MITKEVDQRHIMIIGGIEIFLPSSLVEAKTCIANATSEGQPVVTVIKEEKEKILNYTPGEEQEHSYDMLTPWETKLKLLEDWMNCHRRQLGSSSVRRLQNLSLQ
jgi:hypothetical protein